jgi:hypothetical protein
MKKQALLVAGLYVVIGMAAAPAYAQAGGVRAKVPFSFAVAGKTLPAGEYTMVVGSDQVSVVSVDGGRTIALALANKVSGRSAGANGQIIFHCYGERCFLAEVWTPAREDGRQVVATRSEADLAKEGGEKYFAVLGVRPGK